MIDELFEHGQNLSLQEFKKLIDSSCLPPLKDQASSTIKVTEKNFKAIWDLKDFSDFTIVAGSREIKVHKNVLAAQSSTFASMFKNDEQVALSNKLEVKDCSELAVEQFLESLYTGEITDSKNALDLFSLACTFDAKDFREAYEKMAIESLNEATNVKALVLGNSFNSDKLVRAAFSNLKEMYPDAIKSDELRNNPLRVQEIVDVIEKHNISVQKYEEEIEKLNKM